MKFYCKSCGSPSEYINHLKPKFCSNCGNSFATVTQRQAQRPSVVAEKSVEQKAQADADDEGLYVPDIDCLNFSYDKSFKSKHQVNIKSLAQIHGGNYKKQQLNRESSNYSLEDFRNEAGKAKRNSSE